MCTANCHLLYMVVEEGIGCGEAQGQHYNVRIATCFVLGQMSEEIKPVALAIIELSSFDSITT